MYIQIFNPFAIRIQYILLHHDAQMRLQAYIREDQDEPGVASAVVRICFEVPEAVVQECHK